MSGINKICSVCPHCLDEGGTCGFIVDYCIEHPFEEDGVQDNLDDMLVVSKEKCPYILEHILL